ncbi:hypothetical protein MYX06_02925 [Patescibacteria group bacterium AH-259-L05]|nr:hypothetical protein [Patescibacteria group bacterium AH-259-L05]
MLTPVLLVLLGIAFSAIGALLLFHTQKLFTRLLGRILITFAVLIFGLVLLVYVIPHFDPNF